MSVYGIWPTGCIYKKGSSQHYRRVREIHYFLFSISSKMGKKTSLLQYLITGRTKQKQSQPNYKQTKTPPYTQEMQKIKKRCINTRSSKTSIFANRDLAFSQTCPQDLVSPANSNIWEVMVNTSIFKCIILKQKNASLLC